MRHTFTIIIPLLLPILLEAQEYSQQFGTITPAEWAMTTYARDAKAEAVVIYDIGESKFVADDAIHDERVARALF